MNSTSRFCQQTNLSPHPPHTHSSDPPYYKSAATMARCQHSWRPGAAALLLVLLLVLAAASTVSGDGARLRRRLTHPDAPCSRQGNNGTQTQEEWQHEHQAELDAWNAAGGMKGLQQAGTNESAAAPQPVVTPRGTHCKLQWVWTVAPTQAVRAR